MLMILNYGQLLISRDLIVIKRYLINKRHTKDYKRQNLTYQVEVAVRKVTTD
jgi:hypothetical protein